MTTQGSRARKSLLRLVGVAAIVIGMYLTSPGEGPRWNHIPIESKSTADQAKSDPRACTSLAGIFDEIEGQPRVHQGDVADCYRGVNIVAEPAWVYEIADHSEAGVLWVILALDEEYDGRTPPSRIVTLTVGQNMYPELKDAQTGPRLWVSGRIEEVRSGQIRLGLASLAFPRRQERRANDTASSGGLTGGKPSH